MVSALAAIADPDLILRFFRMAAVKECRGTENRELAAAVACAGAERMSTFLPHFILVNARKRPAGVLGLLARLGREVGRSGKREWRELLAAVAVAVLKGLRLSFRPPLHGRKSPSRKSLDATAGCNLFWLVNSFGTESQSATAVALVARHPARVAPERTVPQALVKMRERDGALVDAPAYEALWRHAASAVLRRSECAPEGPVGWYIEAYLACDCRGCVQLARFCRNSASKRTKIAVNQGERFHLRDKITTLGLDIDFETERRGRPFKLVCTKNRNSHKRRLEEYADDLATMKVLIDAVPTRDGRGLRAEELDRLRGATSSTE